MTAFLQNLNGRPRQANYCQNDLGAAADDPLEYMVEVDNDSFVEQELRMETNLCDASRFQEKPRQIMNRKEKKMARRKEVQPQEAVNNELQEYEAKRRPSSRIQTTKGC